MSTADPVTAVVINEADPQSAPSTSTAPVAATSVVVREESPKSKTVVPLLSTTAPSPAFKKPALRDVLTGILVGFIFGFLLEKSKVYVPDAIYSQMVFKNFIMLKVFLTAMGGGMVVYTILELSKLHTRPPPKNSTLLGGKLLWGVEGNVVGGLLLGSGMSITGACPGQIFAQLGAGVPSAPWALFGGLVAAASFGFIVEAIAKSREEGAFHAITSGKALDQWLGRPLWQICIAFCAALAVVVGLVEWARPWHNDTADYVQTFSNSGLSPFTAPAWSPIAVGALIGALQFLAILVGGSPLGQSSCYVTATGMCLAAADKNLPSHAPYFFRHFEAHHWWQLAMAGANVLGAWTSATISHSTITELVRVTSPGPVQAFFGGYLMLFGARLGDGCPSGHGLSGTARLNAAAFVSVAAMFAGGISTAFLMQAAGY